jgi:hypothetical protein
MIRDKNLDDFQTIDSASLANFKEGDYLFMTKKSGEGFVQTNYSKMDENDIKKYFPGTRK